MFATVVVEGHGESLAQWPAVERLADSPGHDVSCHYKQELAGRARPLQRQSGDHVGGDGFAAAYGVYAFVGFGFQVDFFGGDAEGFREGFAHFGEMRAELGTLEDDDGVDIVDHEMFF